MIEHRKHHRRLPAEWEAQSCIQFTFPHRQSDWADTYENAVDCFVRCITAVAQFQYVLVVCQDRAEVEHHLKNVPKDRLKLVEIPSNDTWARDHAGITIWEDGKAVILDFKFNAWGLKFAADKDNLITQGLFDTKIFENVELRKSGLVLEGGSIESDGKGTLLTTTNCLLSPNRNPHLGKKEIEEELKTYFGLKRVLWLHHGYLEGDDTDAHIDTLARFCDVSTIAYVKCEDRNDTHFEELAKMEQELKSFKTIAGKPYHLVPLPMPEAIYDEMGNRLPATYANFLMINDAVLMPTYDVKQDEEALDILKTVFSKQKVIGINCRALIAQHGSLHCITMQYPVGIVKY